MRILLGALFTLLFMVNAWAQDMKLAVTTSFHNSGLADILLPAIEADTGIRVQLLVVGTGQAIRLGQAGDVDAILVHSRTAENAFVEDGSGTHRREIMYNDFVLLGPQSDPAGIANSQSAVCAFQVIAGKKATFVSRGDESGTHKKELNIWALTGYNPADFESWYRAVGAGMGGALNIASAMNAYILSDRASWLNFKNKGELALLFSGDQMLFNQYSYLPVSPDKHSHVNHNLAVQLEEWLVSDRAKQLINDYQIEGEALFVFNAVPE